MDRVCLLEFLRSVTQMDWIVSVDVDCRAFLPWKGRDVEMTTDDDLYLTLDMWSYMTVFVKYKPLEFVLKLDDNDMHNAMLEGKRKPKKWLSRSLSTC